MKQEEAEQTVWLSKWIGWWSQTEPSFPCQWGSLYWL